MQLAGKHNNALTEMIMPKNRMKVQCHHQTIRNEFPEEFSPEQKMVD